MTIIQGLLGILMLAVALFKINTYKTTLSDDALIEYERKIRPFFIRDYYIGIIPLFVFLGLVMLDIQQKDKFWIIIMLMLVWDIISVVNIHKKIVLTNNKDVMQKMERYLIVFLFGKLCLMIAALGLISLY